jgi:hypothetical protein
LHAASAHARRSVNSHLRDRSWRCCWPRREERSKRKRW